MRKKIIGILICGIFLMTSFSVININTKAECVSVLSETQDTRCVNKIETIPSKIQSNFIPEVAIGPEFGIIIAHGDFYVEGKYVLGHINRALEITNFLPHIDRNLDCNYSIVPPNSHFVYYNLHHTNNRITLIYYLK